MSKCKVHNIELTEGRIPIQYGLIHVSEQHDRARKALFPDANSLLPGGCVTKPSSPTETRGTYCQRCREAEEEWNRRPNPLAGIEDPRKGELVATLHKVREQLAQQITQATDALFPFALEVATVQQKLNLLAHEHGVTDEDFSSTRVDVLLEEALKECVRGIEHTLPALKRTHYDEIHSPGWAG